MQIVYRTHNVTEAYLIKGLLETHGLTCDVVGEYLAGGMGEVSGGNFIFVRVRGPDLTAAMQLIDDMDAGKLDLSMKNRTQTQPGKKK